MLSVQCSKAESERVCQTDELQGHGEGWEVLQALLQRVVLSCSFKLQGTCSAEE